MLDLIDAVAALFEPWTAPTVPVERDGVRTVAADSGVVVDLNGSRPFEFEANHLYLWPMADVHELVESGNPPVEQERFELQVLFVADSADEEAKQIRRRAVTAALEDKAHGYLALVRQNRSKHPDWQHMTGRLDHDTIRNFNVRGAAVRLAGYRY